MVWGRVRATKSRSPEELPGPRPFETRRRNPCIPNTPPASKPVFIMRFIFGKAVCATAHTVSAASREAPLVRT